MAAYVSHSEFAQDMCFLLDAGTDPADFQLAVARTIKFLKDYADVNLIPANELTRADWFCRQLQCMPWSDAIKPVLARLHEDIICGTVNHVPFTEDRYQVGADLPGHVRNPVEVETRAQTNSVPTTAQVASQCVSVGTSHATTRFERYHNSFGTAVGFAQAISQYGVSSVIQFRSTGNVPPSSS